ncbi:MAG: FhaA domain-containing protein [Acidimicrobiales bacterium]
MGIARSLEKQLERFADGLSAAVFRGRMHPVDLANRLVRQADLMVSDGPAGPSIPNHFDVAVSEADLDPSLDTSQLTAELTATLAATAADRGWRTGGPVTVTITTDSTVGRGSIKCAATPMPATQASWGELAEHRGSRTFQLTDNRCVIGRSETADIHLEEAEISRNHAVVFRQGGRLWIADLNSANGTSINGKPVTTDPVETGSGDMLSFGPTTFSVRVS